jgi:hypothetical protein
MPEPEKRIREGFRLKQLGFDPPMEISRLDSVSRKEVIICHMFMNQKLGIQEIGRLLGESYGNVVQVLISRGLVYERRKSRQVVSVAMEGSKTFFKTLH